MFANATGVIITTMKLKIQLPLKTENILAVALARYERSGLMLFPLTS
jgi:hypothetical protein